MDDYDTAWRLQCSERPPAIDPLYANNSTPAAGQGHKLEQIEDVTVDDTMYDTTNSEKAKPVWEQIGLHIYDRANYYDGELLYDNSC